MTRRVFAPEYKAEAVKLVTEQGFNVLFPLWRKNCPFYQKTTIQKHGLKNHIQRIFGNFIPKENKLINNLLNNESNNKPQIFNFPNSELQPSL